MIFVPRLAISFLMISSCVPMVWAQSNPVDDRRGEAGRRSPPACEGASREEDLFSLCMPSALLGEDDCPPAVEFLAKIFLNLPKGTPLRIALDQRTRVDHAG